MEFRKLIFTLAITATVIFVCMFGGTYAYYTLDEGTSLNVTTGNIDTGVAVIFTQNQYINMKTGVPIDAADVANYASKSEFVLNPDNNMLSGYDVVIDISLIDISIANELKVSDFKYDLICSNGTTSTTLTNGIRTGTDFTSAVLSEDILHLGTLSTQNSTLDVTKDYTCNFRVWLQNTTASQNSLMGKSFSGLIKVNVAFRKQ